MTRKVRIDASGALHHLIARDIKKMRIFEDSADSEDFLARRGKGPEGHT